MRGPPDLRSSLLYAIPGAKPLRTFAGIALTLRPAENISSLK
jgi:hypothetical protein